MTFTLLPINLKDAAAATQPMISYSDGTNNAFAHVLLDNTGTMIAPATSARQDTGNTSLASILSTLQAAIPAGSNIIGRITTDQTTHGTTDLVAADITKVAGSAVAVGHGAAATALRVELASDGTGIVGLNAGSAIIGKVGIDQTTPGTTNGVQIVGAIPAGSNIVGKFTTDQTSHGTSDLVAADITKVGGAALVLGQAVAASSIPVVLTAAQITSITAPVLAAGTNIVGKFTTDQTTHGTTDLVAADITKVAGAAISQGHGTAATAIRVELPTDGTGVVGLNSGTNLIGKVGIDQTTPGTTNLVQLPTPLIVTGATTTRPANTTSYVAGYLLAISTTAATVNASPTTIAAARGNEVAGTILRLRLKKSGTSLTNAIFRVHLYNSAPTVTNGDGAAWLTTTSGYVGAFDVTMTQAFSDSAMGVGIPTSGSGVAFQPATGTQNLYYLIEVRAGYTPVSGEVFTPYVEVQ